MQYFIKDIQFWIAFLIAFIAIPFFCFTYSYNTREVNFFYVLLLYPVVEELAFRGAIQDFLSTKLKNLSYYKISLANVLTSLLFVATHLIYHSLLWALLVFIPSLIFGYFKDRTNSVIPGIILHIFYNSIYFYFAKLICDFL